jgi:hypothetical protein
VGGDVSAQLDERKESDGHAPKAILSRLHEAERSKQLLQDHNRGLTEQVLLVRALSSPSPSPWSPSPRTHRVQLQSKIKELDSALLSMQQDNARLKKVRACAREVAGRPRRAG